MLKYTGIYFWPALALAMQSHTQATQVSASPGTSQHHFIVNDTGCAGSVRRPTACAGLAVSALSREESAEALQPQLQHSPLPLWILNSTTSPPPGPGRGSIPCRWEVSTEPHEDVANQLAVT